MVDSTDLLVAAFLAAVPSITAVVSNRTTRRELKSHMDREEKHLKKTEKDIRRKDRLTDRRLQAVEDGQRELVKAHELLMDITQRSIESSDRVEQKVNDALETLGTSAKKRKFF